MMKRFKFLALAAALVVPIAACDEGSEGVTVVEGSIVGTVTVEGTGVSGVTVTAGGQQTTTDASGAYSFEAVPAGSYTVTISGFPADASFGSTSKGVVIQNAGQVVTANFDGSYVRTSAISGSVTADGAGLAGITVTLSGAEADQVVTGANGAYQFTGLRGGSYTVAISGFDANKYSFSSTSQSVTLATGGSQVVNFAGQENATGSVTATVTLDGAGLRDVVVTLNGSTTLTTNSNGQAVFTGLDRGSYTVAITNPDPTNYAFDNLSGTATITEIGGSASVAFTATTIADASISGRIYIDVNENGEYDQGIDEPLSDIDVSNSNGESFTTLSDGTYTFTGLASGTYTVSFTNPDETVYAFNATSAQVVITNPKAPYSANFRGTIRMDNSLSGSVFIDTNGNEQNDVNEGIGNVTLTIQEAGISTTTGQDGRYAFPELPSGQWTVVCEDCADLTENEFNQTSAVFVLDGGANVVIDFFATADAASAQVTVNVQDPAGIGIPGVEISLSGGGERPGLTTGGTGTTDQNGQVIFTNLDLGTYTLVAKNPDPLAWMFDETVQTFVIEQYDATPEFFFTATLIETTISGTVTAESVGPLAGIDIYLDGEVATQTAADGSYSLTVTSGVYEVSLLTGPDEPVLDTDIWTFDPSDSQTIDASNATTGYTANFEAELRRDYTLFGYAWYDIGQDGVYNPSAVDQAAAGVTISLQTGESTTTDANGYWEIPGLVSSEWVGADYTVTCSQAACAVGNWFTYNGDQENIDDANTAIPGKVLSVPASESVVGGTGNQVNFYSQGSSVIMGSIWHDVDYDGVKDDEDILFPDAGAPNVTGITVTLQGPAFGQSTTINLDADGSFRFENLPAGNYNLNVNDGTIPGTYAVSRSAPASGGHNITLGSGVDETRDFLYGVDAFRVQVYVHYGPESSTAANAGDRVALYQSEQLGDLGGNQIATDYTDGNGLATFLAPRSRVTDDYVLYTCVEDALAGAECNGAIIQTGAANWNDPVLEHNVDKTQIVQTWELDHDMVFYLVDVWGTFVEQDGDRVANVITNNARVGLLAQIGVSTANSSLVEPIFSTIGPDDTPGDDQDNQGNARPGDDEGDFYFNDADITNVYSPAQIAGTVYVFVRGSTHFERGDCAVNSCDNLLRFSNGQSANRNSEYVVYAFNGTTRTLTPVNHTTRYPNPDLRFLGWHELTDVLDKQVPGDDILEVGDLEAVTYYDRNDNNGREEAPVIDCLDPSMANPTPDGKFTCIIDRTDAGVDLADDVMDLAIRVRSNDAPNSMASAGPELVFVPGSSAWNAATDIDNVNGTYDPISGTRAGMQVEIGDVPDTNFWYDLGDMVAYKFQNNTARGIVWNENGPLVDFDGIRDEGTDGGTERAVRGINIELSVPASGIIGVDPSFTRTKTTVPNGANNAGIVQFDGLMEGNYVVTMKTVDGTIFTGTFSVVDRIPGAPSQEFAFVPSTDFAGSVKLAATMEDVKADVAKQFEVAYTNGYITGYVFENLDDNNIIDPSEGQVGAGQIVQLQRFNEFTGLFENYAQATADQGGFYGFQNIVEGNYQFYLVTDPNGTVGSPMMRTKTSVDLNRSGGQSVFAGQGVNLLGLMGNEGDAFPGNWEFNSLGIGETDLEMVHDDGTIQFSLISTGTGAFVPGVDVTLSQCAINAGNVESDSDGTGGICSGPTTLQTQVTNDIAALTFSQLTEGFYQIRINTTQVTSVSGNPNMTTEFWVVRIDRQGEVAARTSVVTPM